jgi:signal transduction histidine kinase
MSQPAEWGAYERLPDPILVLDGAWRIVYANPAALREAGSEGLEGSSVLDVFRAWRGTSFERRLREVGEQGRALRFTHFSTDERFRGSYDVTLVPLAEGLLVELQERAGRVSAESPEEAARLTEGLVEAGMALSSALSLDGVLQVLVDVARELAGARFAALGVLNATRTGLSAFVTSGLTPEQQSRIGHEPTGHGILGLLIRDPRPLRLRDLREHAASAGVPPHHPAMRSFLGVPVMAKGRVFGNLYVTEKLGAEEFSENDLLILEMLAAQAATAIENAQLRRERDRFFATASHELGNAVAGVQVWARHLLRKPPERSEEWVEGLGKILKGAEAAQKLIEDLLSLSKIQEGRLTLTSWPVDLREVAAEAVAQLWPEAEAAGVRLQLLSPDGGRPVVESDPIRVRQILVNLLSNATKFTAPGGCVLVGIETLDDGGVVVWVQDEGPGISVEDVERVFQPFEQVSGMARGRGAGLGLPLSRQLARLMGGDLSVESKPGAGSTFRLRLPRAMPRRTRTSA